MRDRACFGDPAVRAIRTAIQSTIYGQKGTETDRERRSDKERQTERQGATQRDTETDKSTVRLLAFSSSVAPSTPVSAAPASSTPSPGAKLS